MKKILILAFLLVIVTSGIFAGGGGEKGEKTEHTIFGSSSLGGSWYPTASKLGTVGIKYEDLSITVQSSGGGTENVRLMAQGQYQFGLVEPNIANYAYQGVKVFAPDGPQTNLRVMTNLYSNVAAAVVMKNGSIETFYDYDSNTNGGKKYGFAPGSPGSGDEYCWEEIFSNYGVTKDQMDWKPLSHSERAMAFKDRILEGIGFTTAQPAGSIIESSAQTPIRILAIEGEDRDRLIKEFPWYYPHMISAGMYNGIDEDVQTVALGGFVCVDASVSEEFVYKFLSAIYGPGLKEVQSVVAATKEITLENAIVGNEAESVPFHPGAERFYKEKGILK